MIHFPTTITGDQHKSMKIAYVVIYSQIIEKLAKIDDPRVNEFISMTRSKVIDFLITIQNNPPPRQHALDFVNLCRDAFELSNALSSNAKHWSQEDIMTLLNAVIRTQVIRVGNEAQEVSR